MIVVSVLARVRPEKVAAYEAAAREMIEYVRANEPGTVFYNACKHRDQPHTYRVIEVYKDQAARDIHMNGPLLPKVRDFITNECLVGGSWTAEFFDTVA